MKFRLPFLFVALTLTTSCMSPSIDLEEKARNVTVWRKDSGDHKSDVNRYEKVKYVNCALGANARPVGSNEKACENQLRNEALRLGAEVIWIDEMHQNGASDHYGKNCNNCVVMGGWAYRKKTAKSVPQNEAPESVAAGDEAPGQDDKKAERKKILGSISENAAGEDAETEPFRMESDNKPVVATPPAAKDRASSTTSNSDLDSDETERAPSSEK